MSQPLTGLQNILTSIYSVTNTDLHITLSPSPYPQFQSFVVKFNKFLRQSPQMGLVSQDGLFITFNSTVITDPAAINNIVTNFSPQGPFDADLNIYLDPNNVVYLVDALHTPPQFALVNGQTFDITSPYFNTANVYLFLTASDVSGGQNLVFATKYPGDFVQNIKKGLNYFRFGNPCAPKKLYFVFDPNCIGCHYSYQGLKDYVLCGKLVIYLIPFIASDNTARGKIWAIFDGQYPPYKNKKFFETPERQNKESVNAYVYDEEFYNINLYLNTSTNSGSPVVESGGLIPISKPSKCAALKLDENLVKLNNVYGVGGTPTFYYINTSGVPTISIVNPFDPNSFDILFNQIKSL